VEACATRSFNVSAFAAGGCELHLKFGKGNLTATDGNKLTITFE
jgi:hypothetical protein